MAGYAIIALALILFVQASNVYPQLLLGRLLFSLGGSAVSTMVTAVLPTVTGGSRRSGQQRRSQHAWRASLSSEVTITPSRFERRASRDSVTERASDSSSRLAGFVGLFAGCGALIALSVFLPLPARFERQGSSPSQAVKQSYYIVAAIAVVVSTACFFGLRNLPGEQGKHLRLLWTRGSEVESQTHSAKMSNLLYAFKLSVKHPDICLGYVGGFVARASSVGISLFIPLFVNYYFRSSDLCNKTGSDAISPTGLGDIKKSCPEAYILASILTGVSQLIALLTAPAFGYLSEKSRVHNFPLLFAAISGIIGYVAFPLLPSPQFKGSEGNGSVFLIMGLIGISQIGAIVCSLGILSNGVLNFQSRHEQTSQPEQNPSEAEEAHPHNEHEPLLSKPGGDGLDTKNLNHLKGSIAGIYSLYGGAGILILTKLGGLLFDELSSGAPFYIMAIFNGVLLVSGLGCSLWRY